MIITKLMTLWASPKVKMIVIAVIVTALFAGVRIYGNKQWTLGVEEGFVRAAGEIERVKKAKWADRERQIEDTKATIEDQIQILNEATGEIAAARARIKDQYTSLTARDVAQRDADEKIVIAVSDSGLRTAIIEISNELAGK